MKIKSINDKNIFTKQYHHFSGLKLILCSDNYGSDITEFITKMLDTGKYKVIPYSNYYYCITYKTEWYYISFNSENLILQDEKYKNIKPFYVKEHEEAIKNSSTSFTDKYRGTYYLFQDKKYWLNLIIYSSETEIDGFFETMDKINIKLFKAPIIYKNYSENNITSNSLLLYEIKSGDQKEKIIEQMRKRCQFIHNYLRLFYDFSIPIYYFGFYTEKSILNYEINLDNSDSVKNNIINDYEDEKTGESSLKKNNYGKNNEQFPHFQNEQKENLASDEKKAEHYLNQEKQSPIDKEIMNDFEEINQTNENEIFLDESDTIMEDYPELQNLPMKIVIFRLKDTIFGEKLKYEKEELNLLGTLRDDTFFMKKKIKEIITQLKSRDKKIEVMNNKIDLLINKQNQSENILKSIAKELKINLEDNNLI